MGKFHFTLIDDESSANFIVKVILRRVCRDAETVSFENPCDALNYLKTRSHTNADRHIVFLDLNMPQMNGFELLKELNTSDETPIPYHIYILSSSVDPTDKNMAKSFSMVQDFLEKPLTVEKLEEILANPRLN